MRKSCNQFFDHFSLMFCIISIIRFVNFPKFNHMIKIFYLLSVPLDYSIIKREHFNRHYSSLAYYIAFNLADAPLLIICSIIYNIISYLLTGQPLEEKRILMLIAIGIVTCFAAQIFGIFCGSMFNVMVNLLTLMVQCPF